MINYLIIWTNETFVYLFSYNMFDKIGCKQSRYRRYIHQAKQESCRVPIKVATEKKVFGHFLLLDGSIWTETMLYDQGISLRRSGYPTCLYLENN